MEALLSGKGVNGQIEVFEDKIRIRRKGVMSFLSQGIKGDKEIYANQISSIQFKKASFVTNGYIQFAFLGGQETKGGIFNATKDENTIMFTKAQGDQFEKIRDLIETIIWKLRSESSSKKPSVDDLISLKKLMDEGVITEEEFLTKKKQILGI